MVFVPIRGIFLLGRTAFLIAAAAAVPVLLKKNRKLADQVGSTLIKAGEKLKQEYGGAEEIKKEEPVKAASAPAPAAKTTPAKPKAKAASVKSKAKAQAQAKPNRASKSAARKSSAKLSAARKAPRA